jgi:prophage regulatory protein
MLKEVLMQQHDNSALRIERLIPLTAVREATGLSRSTIFRLVSNARFPEPVKPSKGRIAWREREVLAWLASVH